MTGRTEVDVEAFTRDWNAGTLARHMATTHGCSEATVSKVAQRLGLPGRRKPAHAAHEEPSPKDTLTGGEWVRAAGGIMRWQPAQGTLL